MSFIFALFFFVLGTLFWSFGSVLLTRLSWPITKKTLQSITIGRSLCPICKKNLSWYNLVPIFSFFFQKGKCTSCMSNISFFYPLLEILSGIVFVVTFFRGNIYGIPDIWFYIGINWFLCLLFVRDWKTSELHVPIRVLFVVRILGGGIFSFSLEIWIQRCIFLLFFLLVFFVIYRVGKRYAQKRYGYAEWLGLGDVYVGAVLGFLLPSMLWFSELPQSRETLLKITLLFFLCSSFFGLLQAGCTRLFCWKKIIEIPFFPAMILSFRCLLFFWRFLISWYTSFFF